jgi:cell division protease FtsH
VALGGRVAEELVFGSITTGAENDIQQLTAMVRHMVGRWGMSDAIGPIAVLPADQQQSPFGGPEVSADTQRALDREARRVVDDAHAQITELLRGNRERLEGLAAALLEHETLDELAARDAAGLDPRTVEPSPEPGRAVPAR